MEEDDYINVTNLTRLRIVNSILRDVTAYGPVSKEMRIGLINAVEDMEEAITKAMDEDD